MRRIMCCLLFAVAVTVLGCSGSSEPEQPKAKANQPIPPEVQGPPESGMKKR